VGVKQSNDGWTQKRRAGAYCLLSLRGSGRAIGRGGDGGGGCRGNRCDKESFRVRTVRGCRA